MLISTSRKPSQKTRKFCKTLARTTDSTSVNRGKMNMRELLLKALELDEINVAVVNEIKGNPSKITFYSNKGEVLLVLLISVSMDNNEKLNIAPSQLKIVSSFDKLNVLSDILDIDLVDIAEDNFIIISQDDDLVAKINFVNKFGEKLKFQINVKKILEAAHD
ncbi:MAG: ribonucleotide-diphosphate reductase subunit beta [Methanobrevibacter sp.]|uniref:Brix domain-containing protein n=1 Tax=Methanobrevibacter sp. TaxID=66852 RepID=UPI001D623D10|nr:ribonucleotide-diphosphate reductase subunit beta [Methanobrevibacter sp.]MBE6489922.1 ribonucleotide-diphosphate reductase subunit beta [Methanobrevibacter sp.]